MGHYTWGNTTEAFKREMERDLNDYYNRNRSFIYETEQTDPTARRNAKKLYEMGLYPKTADHLKGNPARFGHISGQDSIYENDRIKERLGNTKLPIENPFFRKMKMIKYFIGLCIIIFCSCNRSQTNKNLNLIIGEWKAIDNYKPEIYGYIPYLNGYNFMEDGLCDNYPGFFSYFEPKGFLLHASEKSCIESRLPRYLFGGVTALNNVRRFHGNRSSYKIIGDTLKIYDPSKNVWFNQQIHFESPDTMVLSYVDECQELIHIAFIRMKYDKNEEDKLCFDQLIFNYPDCAWQSKIFSIQQDGTLISYGYKREGEFFIGKVNNDELKNINQKFKRIDFQNIAPDYHFPWYYFHPKIIIIKGTEMKIISAMTVTEKNKEFYWAYISTLFSPDNIYIQPIDQDKYIKNNFLKIQSKMLSYCEFISEESVTCFQWIEVFYLKQLLMSAKETEQSFIPQYNVNLYYDQKIKIETDGRYYRITDSNGNVRTLDIGVDFIKGINRVYININEQYGGIEL
jgi:hypothetical protein